MTRSLETTINFVPANLPVKVTSGNADFYGYASNKQSLTVHDAREQKDYFTPWKNGFQYINHTSAYIPISDPSKIKSDFYAEVDELFKEP